MGWRCEFFSGILARELLRTSLFCIVARVVRWNMATVQVVLVLLGDLLVHVHGWLVEIAWVLHLALIEGVSSWYMRLVVIRKRGHAHTCSTSHSLVLRAAPSSNVVKSAEIVHCELVTLRVDFFAHLRYFLLKFAYVWFFFSQNLL